MHSAAEQMRADRQQVWSFALMSSLAGLLLVGAALADAADDLAGEIEQTIDDIAAQIRIQPERALAELNEQERQFDTLIQIEPEHPAIRELRMRLDELEARLSDPTDTPVISAPSVDIDRSLRRLRSRLKEAETAWLSKETARAALILQEVRFSLDELRRERGREIPQGYVALFVLEERLLVLERELGDDGDD